MLTNNLSKTVFAEAVYIIDCSNSLQKLSFFEYSFERIYIISNLHRITKQTPLIIFYVEMLSINLFFKLYLNLIISI